jgi:hypothetical protein
MENRGFNANQTLFLKNELSDFLSTKGTEAFAKIVSDAINDLIDKYGEDSLAVTRSNFVAKFNAHTKINLTNL